MNEAYKANQKQPKGWLRCKLGEISQIIYGKELPTKNLVTQGFPVYGANGIIGFYDDYLFEDEQLLISCRGAYSGKINYSSKTCYITNNSLVVDIFINKSESKKFYYYILQAVNKSKLISGTAQPQVTINNAVELEVPLPPLPEQRSIVAKLEELFSELDNGVEALKTIHQQLKVYRQSVLKWAFEGKLTDEWRKQNKGFSGAKALLEQIRKERVTSERAGGKKERLNNHTAIADSVPHELDLPEGWCWVKMEEIFQVSGGLTKNPSRNSKELKYSYLRVANVYSNKLNLSEVLEIGVDSNEVPKTLLKKEDLLIVEGNGSLDQIGRVAIWNDSINNCLHQNHIIKARGTQATYARFFLYYLISNRGRNEITSKAASTSGLFTLSISKVSAFNVPLCSLEEQQAIVHEIESRLSVADKLEETIEQSLRQAEALRQSILKKAFKGRLLSEQELAEVRSDPEWEPASVLFDRIKAQKANSEPEKNIKRGKKQI
jgi:type I restriction enzyme S subunit